MRNNRFLLSIILVLTLCVSLLTLILIRTFLPAAILPQFNVGSILIVSLIALVINYYLSDRKYDLFAIAFAFVAFGVLPYVSGFVTVLDALILALKGACTFAVAMFMFTSILERVNVSGKNIVAPVITALMLYLAFQCFIGMM